MLNIFENIGNMLENIGNYARKCQTPFVLTYLFVDDISSRRGYAGFPQMYEAFCTQCTLTVLQ